MRQYAVESAPLRRVTFRTGDRVRLADGTDIVIDDVADTDGVLTYVAGDRRVPEFALSDHITFDQPLERLQNRHVDAPPAFDLRVSALDWRCAGRKSPIRGFIGGRVSLIPHQFYIAHEVASRPLPRVLLADEVGLGKTIEACLIVHRLCRSGLASRILVLVPDSLIHQWFLEFYRRFNLWFSIYDEDRCRAATPGAPGGNPFLSEQLVLCGVSLLVDAEKYRTLAVDAGWDVVVVDEAHHLRWSPESSSPEYDLVEALSRIATGLLLLTATPEQLGHSGHFARLRLLDPDRYPDFHRFEKETERFGDVATAAGRLAAGTALSDSDCRLIGSVFAEDPERVTAALDKIRSGDRAARDRLLDEMLDRHGPGRVVFRNTRHTIKGFPQRHLHIHRLDGSPEQIATLHTEFEADLDPALEQAGSDGPKPKGDTRMQWLTELLHDLGDKKVLLICRTKERAAAVDAALKKAVNIKTALFHEDLPLIQRDRNAFWFAEENGARILICSEIGSEGRNFQFAHHLVLFDLPLDPELLEQRIGRLDRIGQSADVNIHVPVVRDSPQERLAAWYQDGLDAFAGPTTDAELCIERFGERVRALAAATVSKTRVAWDALVAETREYHLALTRRAAAGRDHLLELGSCRKDTADKLVAEIKSADADRSLEEFMYNVFDWYGVKQEETSPRTYVLSCEDLYTDGVPGLSVDGATVTFLRQRALAHENVEFLTGDHPMVIGALDLILGSDLGKSCLATMDGDSRGVLMEAVFVVECSAPTRLHADRFLAPTPVRVVVDHKLTDRTAQYPTDTLTARLSDGELGLLGRRELTHSLVPAMHDKAKAVATEAADRITADAREAMVTILDRELERLIALRQINDHVREDEITAVTAQRDELHRCLSDTGLRLDCIRLIWVK